MILRPEPLKAPNEGMLKNSFWDNDRMEWKMFKLSLTQPAVERPGRTQFKAGRLHVGIFYETECLENSGAHLLVVLADVYNIYLRLRLSGLILH